MIRVIVVIAILLSYLNLATALDHSDCADKAGYTLLLKESSICIPESFALDVRYFTSSNPGVILRELRQGEENGKTIAIAFHSISKENKDAIEKVGYRKKKRCGYDVLIREKERKNESIVVFLDLGFLQFTNLDDHLIENIFSMLCDRTYETDEGDE